MALYMHQTFQQVLYWCMKVEPEAGSETFLFLFCFFFSDHLSLSQPSPACVCGQEVFGRASVNPSASICSSAQDEKKEEAVSYHLEQRAIHQTPDPSRNNHPASEARRSRWFEIPGDWRLMTG